MKKLQILILISILVFISNHLVSQGFPDPSQGNAAIYFIRVSRIGGGDSFEFFHKENFIGIFKGKNYMRYECPAGEQLLWASSENKEFLNCDFKVGETYFVLVNIKAGAWKARVGLEPLTINNEDFQRAKDLVNSKPPKITTIEKINSTQSKLDSRGFIKDIMQRYENEWKNERITKTISSEMYIPKDYLK